MDNIAHKKQFVKIPVEFFENGWATLLRHEELKVFLFLWRWRNSDLNISHPSLRTISKKTKTTLETVRHVIDRLIFFNLIRICHRKEFIHVQYNVYTFPLTFPKISEEWLQSRRNMAWTLRQRRQEIWKLRRQGIPREAVQDIVKKSQTIQDVLEQIRDRFEPK